MADDVSNIIKESIDAVLQNQQYNENKASHRARRPLPQGLPALDVAGTERFTLRDGWRGREPYPLPPTSPAARVLGKLACVCRSASGRLAA